MKWLFPLFFLFVILTVDLTSAAAPLENDSLVVLAIRFYEKSEQDSKDQILAEPVLMTRVGNEYGLDMGYVVKPKHGLDDLECGFKLSGKIEINKKSELVLHVKLARGKPVVQEEDPETDLVKTDTIDLRVVLQLGQKKRIQCSPTQWCEVLIDTLKETDWSNQSGSPKFPLTSTILSTSKPGAAIPSSTPHSIQGTPSR